MIKNYTVNTLIPEIIWNTSNENIPYYCNNNLGIKNIRYINGLYFDGVCFNYAFNINNKEMWDLEDGFDYLRELEDLFNEAIENGGLTIDTQIGKIQDLIEKLN